MSLFSHLLFSHPFSSTMQPSLRRKFSSAAAAASSFSMKPAASAARRSGNLSAFVVILSIFLFGCFMYNEDVKSLAEFPFSSSPRPRALDTQTTTVSVVMNARTVVETEVEGAVSDDGKGEVEKQSKMIQLPVQEEAEEEEDEEDGVEIPPEECDLFDGNWVFDNTSYPIYKEDRCEFLTAQVTCLRNGRRDSLYQNWRWQPRECSLPK